MVNVSRRSLFAGFAALVACPAIVKVVSFLPEPIKGKLTFSQMNREVIRSFRNSNAFLRNIDTQYNDEFGKIGTQLRIRLPKDYIVKENG